MNIYERSCRTKLRFTSSVGLLTTEDLFDLPLTATSNKVSLDRVAREVYSELKTFSEISFVETTPEPRKIELELKMEIIKDIIESKKTAMAAAETRVKKAELRRQLTEALAKKQGEQIEGLSVEDIQKKLSELAE